MQVESELVDVQTVYYVVEIVVGLTVIGGVVYGSIHWFRRDADGKEEKIACEDCQTVFTPKWVNDEDDDTIESATCPQCSHENVFEVDEDDD